MSDTRIMTYDDRLAALAAETGGSVPVAEIGRVVAGLMQSLEREAQGIDADTAQELADLLAYVHQTREDIAAIQPAELTGEHIPHANDQLRSVVHATEEATGVFLDAAEELEHLADELGGAEAERLRSITTRIYEASNFQDITGQRIAKVVTTLEVIEERLSRLVHIAGEAVRAAKAAPAEPAPAEPAPEDLLNGPQLPDLAATQDDIDRLFASL
jgi:chemotaxis protein CheZ